MEERVPVSRIRIRKPRLLLVLAEPAALRDLEQGLRSKLPIFEVHSASTGSQAMQQVERVPFHVVLTELNMPVMNGIELLDVLATYHPRTIRLVYSAQIDTRRRLPLGQRAHGVLRKPATLQEILELTAWALRESTWQDPAQKTHAD